MEWNCDPRVVWKNAVNDRSDVEHGEKGVGAVEDGREGGGESDLAWLLRFIVERLSRIWSRNGSDEVLPNMASTIRPFGLPAMCSSSFTRSGWLEG